MGARVAIAVETAEERTISPEPSIRRVYHEDLTVQEPVNAKED